MYFITICCKGHKQLLGQVVGDDARDVPNVALNNYGKIVEQQIRMMDSKYYNVFIDKYIVMPNHVHFILTVSSTSIEEYDKNIRVGFYGVTQAGTGTSQASSPTKETNKTELRGSLYRQHEIVPKFISLLKRLINCQIGTNIWQRGYYDHIIRNEDDYRNIYQYIENNPAHWAEDKYYIG